MVDLKSEKPVAGLEKYSLEFLEDRKNELNAMLSCLKDSNFMEISRLAHKWKGFCEPYGFNNLESLARKLEITAGKNNIKDTSELIHKIEEYLKLKEEILLKLDQSQKS